MADEDDDNLSSDFSVGQVSQLSIATTAYNTTTTITDADSTVAATNVTGDLDMQALPKRGGISRYSAIEPITADIDVTTDISKSASGRDRNTSNTTLGGTTIIDEQHANYVLMYDMLTGIRISVCHKL
jgi:hypothetical protein